MASTSEWFESIAEAQRRARRRLPKSVYNALIAGAERGATATANVDAFGEIGLVPRVATGVPAGRDQATTVLGQEIALPVVTSPVGAQAVHHDGELAVARATAASGTAMGLSSFATMPLADVAAANPKTFFQVYWMGDRERIERTLERARDDGAAGLVVTLDWTFAHRRDWGSAQIPERLDLRSALRFAPEALARPRWLAGFLRNGGPPDLTIPNVSARGEAPPTFFGAYGEWMQTPQPTWDDIAWMRERWGGPFLVKGIAHPDDARAAVSAGADAISVSNHGGNNLDGAPAAIRLLPGVAEAVGGDVEVLLDGGVRRGSDVVKALALGARAVLIGRAHLWGLAAGGEAGVANVLEILRAGIDETLAGLGRASIHDVTPDDVLAPDDFAVRPRAATAG